MGLIIGLFKKYEYSPKFSCTRKWDDSLSDDPPAENVEDENNYQALLVNQSPIKMWDFWILVLAVPEKI
jgi:hypothetical protein